MQSCEHPNDRLGYGPAGGDLHVRACSGDVEMRSRSGDATLTEDGEMRGSGDAKRQRINRLRRCGEEEMRSGIAEIAFRHANMR